MPWATFLSQPADQIDRSPTYLHLNRPSLALPDEKKVIGPKPGCIFAPATAAAAAIGAVGAVGAGGGLSSLGVKRSWFSKKKVFSFISGKNFFANPKQVF